MAKYFRMLSGGLTSSIEEYLDEYTAAAKRILPLMPEGWVITSAGPGIQFGNTNGPGGQSFTNEVIRSMLAYLDKLAPSVATIAGWRVVVRENEIGEQYTELLNPAEEVVASEWGECEMADFAEHLPTA